MISSLESELEHQNSKKTHTKKKRWTHEEDNHLAEVVKQYGNMNWTLVSSYMEGRSGKQCRERWVNKISPMVKQGTWSLNEDITIIQACECFGHQWSLISKMIPGRSANAVKNRFSALQRRIGSKKIKVRKYSLMNFFPVPLLIKDKKQKLADKQNDDNNIENNDISDGINETKHMLIPFPNLRNLIIHQLVSG